MNKNCQAASCLPAVLGSASWFQIGISVTKMLNKSLNSSQIHENPICNNVMVQ
jgi:hypothetical protein